MAEDTTFSEAEREFLEAFVKILHHLHGRAVKAEREVISLRKELDTKREQVEVHSILAADGLSRLEQSSREEG